MKIIVDKDIPFLKDRFPTDVETLFIPGNKFSPEIVRDADALIIRTRTRCDKNLLKDSKVKLIATATIGTDHIDIPWCEKEGIKVVSAPGCNAPGVVQYVLASLLYSGFDPSTQSLGIVGYGNVGSIVARWAQKLGIKTLISDDPRKDAGYTDVNYLPLEEVLAKSDAVTLHVPLTLSGPYKTKGLIGEDRLNMMKHGAWIINSSRGGVINEDDLKEYLAYGKVKAIIDVWVNEPDIDTQLLELVKVGTPHIAGYSEEGKLRATKKVLEAVAHELGITVDFSNLDSDLTPNDEVSAELIKSSYNPLIDFEMLRFNPTKFEAIRNNYNYRQEP